MSQQDIQHILVVGGGLIGCGWAVAFAAAGLKTTVLDPDHAVRHSLKATYRSALEVQQRLGLSVSEAAEPVHVTSLEEISTSVDFIQEALPEVLDLKKRVFRELESTLPTDIVIASSSSGILPSHLQADMRYPERLIIGHPCNPPYLMPVVEVCGGAKTQEKALATAKSLYERLGKTVLRLDREAPGHLINRLQAALWREAVHLVRGGYASMETVEKAVTDGLAPRWTLMGPSMIFHLAGGEAGLAKFLGDLGGEVEEWWSSLGQPALDPETCSLLESAMAEVTGGQSVQELSRQRDQLLPALMKAIKIQKENTHSLDTSGGHLS